MYCSIVDGFLRSPFVLGLSYVDAVDPDTSEGVLMIAGGCKTLLYLDVDRPRASAGGNTGDGGGTEKALFDAAEGTLYAAVTGAGAAILFLVSVVFSGIGAIDLLDLFASFDTCCVALPCLLSA